MADAIVGQIFGKLTAMRLLSKRYSNRGGSWLCLCECGETRIIPYDTLRRLKSCGCHRWKANERHGMYKSSEYTTWEGMIQRCSNSKSPAFGMYGGRGIEVCDRWKLFENFYADVGPKPSRKHQIDRIDGKGNYEPGNVRWATTAEQRRNTTQIRMLTYQGRSQCLTDWANEVGIAPRTLSHRIVKFHWPTDKALTVKPRPSYARSRTA